MHRQATPPAPPPGPVPGLLGAVASWAYAREIGRRNRAYDAGKHVVRLDRPVVSVGNLTMGGTGKSPMVAWIVEHLREAGHKPCIAMRGYKPKGRRAGRMSDEAEEYRERFGRRVPVVAQPNRIAGLRELVAGPEGKDVDCIVLDDGFQHRKVARDRDIVLVDATRSPLADTLLPAGWLREPVESLRRATAIVLTHAESVNPDQLRELSRQLEAAAGQTPMATVRHAWSGFRVFDGGRERTVPLAWLGTRKVFATCAIGNPEPFLKETTRRAGVLAGVERRRDHDPYTPETAGRVAERAIECGADTIACTGKDWVKLSRSLAGRWSGAVAIPLLLLVFDSGEAELRQHVLSALGS